VRAAPAEDGHGPDGRFIERFQRMANDVRAFEFVAGLRQDARAVERDIAVADDDRVDAAERRVEVG
jgi:hypothetical protein